MAAPAPRNVHSAASLCHFISASVIPGADPQIKTTFDAIAIASHACMLAVGFRLIGLGEDHKIEADSDPSSPQPLPTEWNANNGNYSFRYRHSQSSMEFLLKVNRMANKAIVMGMGMGDDRTCSYDVTVRDYISDGNVPAAPVKDGQSQSDTDKKIADVFISAGRLSDYGSLMRTKIIQRLVPSVHKEGYEESQESQSLRANTNPPDRQPQQPQRDPLREDRYPPARPHPLHDPLVQPPRRPMPEPMPGFEDEFEALRPPRGGLGGPGMPRYGERDLYPAGLGPRDPLYGGVGPGLAPPGGGGGMHPTFDDPMFGGQGQGGQGYDPLAPPGSRYDPVGPRGGGHPRGAGMGGRPPNPFGGFGGGDFI